ncbi:DMT family transporter [Cohnella sp. JJ-181]|uniref:DMT family transporter n=1 Tax=Cohnella rhizoplanae TaxID=2974897 RepID=UPI0022FF6641|nr:DMT family transporter [Cohnella sp. JJ-181]CAI6032481.1 hypothetical protein COHCIP112018_00759 [Cohnella sp. JJ-181]
MLMGITLAFLSGVLVGLQNIFNSKLGERTNIWITTTLVLGMGFAASFTIGLVVEGGDLFVLKGMQTWYGFSGIIGVVVVVSMVQGIQRLGPTFAVSVMMVSQLGFALLFDTLGWLGLAQIPISPSRVVGLLVVAAGIAIFKTDPGRLRGLKLRGAKQGITNK